MTINTTEKKGERTTAVWQNGGFSAKSTVVLRLNFCAKLNICASISATSPSCKPLAVRQQTTRNNRNLSNEYTRLTRSTGSV